MARDFCTWSTCLVRALGTFRRFPDTSRHPRKKMVAQTSPLSLGVCTCAFVCIFVCWKIGKWRRRNPPKKFKSEHAVVVAMLIIYFLNFFFIYHCFTSKSNISSAFHMYLFTFFMVVFVRSPFCCFCVGVCLPLIYLSFYSQNSS